MLRWHSANTTSSGITHCERKPMTDKASSITPPRRRLINSVESRNGQFVAFTTTHAVVALEAHLRNRYISAKAFGGAVSFVFSDLNAGEVDHTLTGNQASTTNIGYTLADGEEASFELGGADNYIVLEGSASGTLKLWGTGPKSLKGQSTDKP